MPRPCVPFRLLSLLLLAGPLGAQGEGDPGVDLALQSYLKAPNTDAGDRFGRSVAMSGDRIVVGAPFEDSQATGIDGDGIGNLAGDAGAAYIYVRQAGSWVLEAYLKASNAEAGDNFGASVDISGDVVVVGAPLEDGSSTGVEGDVFSNGAVDAGAAYVFRRDEETGVWAEDAYLKASNTNAGDQFGNAVSVSGDNLVVGAWLEDGSGIGVNPGSNNAAPQAGAAYTFVYDPSGNGAWIAQNTLKASNTDPGDAFGWAVAVSGDRLVVGAYGEDGTSSGPGGNQAGNGFSAAGAAYAFVFDPELGSDGRWAQEVYLKASNTGAFDQFGWAVAVDGDTVVVGARQEDGAATGVDGDQGSNAAERSGAAYVFLRTVVDDEPVWTQQAYLKPSNTDAEDGFGRALAVSGDRVLVGAQAEDSGATDVDGDELDNGALSAGAAYLFERAGETWSQSAYLKATNTDATDSFAASVDLAPGSLVVGADSESSATTGVDGDQAINTSSAAGAVYAYDLDAWTDLGAALAGASGEPLLSAAGSLHPTSTIQLDLTNAAPSATAALFIGFASTPVPFKGGTLVPNPSLPPVFAVTDGGGTFPVIAEQPAGVPSGSEVYVQWAIQDDGAVFGVALSNAVRGVTP